MQILKLLEVCEVYQPKTIPKKDLIEDGKYFVYGANGKIGRFNKYNHSEEEVLLGCRGSVGSLNISEPYSWITGNAMVVKPKSNQLLKKYVYYFLLSLNKKNIVTGSSIPQITRKSLETVEIPVPSLQEQEKIVERLGKVFENIDKNQEQILNLKFLYSQIKDSFINKKLSNEKTEVLSSFSDIQYGYTPDKNSKEKIQVPILRITDIQNNKVDWENVPNVKVSQETFDKFYLKKGDILFARTGGTLGKSYLFNEDKKAIFASYLIRVTNTKSDFNPKFLKYFFESTEYWKQVNQGTIGAAQPFFNGKKLGNLKIPYSNKDEQKLIIKKLDKLTDLIEELNDLNMLKKNKYSNFQKSILNKEFSYE